MQDGTQKSLENILTSQNS